MQELTLPGEDGKKVLYPRMKIWGQVDLGYLAEHINYASTFTPGDIIGLVKSLTQAIAREMGEGHSVKIDGLGVFTPSLGIRDGFERESGEPGGQKRNAMSIYMQNINFRADKEFIQETGMHCRLEPLKVEIPAFIFALYGRTTFEAGTKLSANKRSTESK